MFSGFCQCDMKERLYWDAQLWGYSLFSVYLQRCMNIWLMSHGLWRNLITVLLYKARPLTVNTAANSVIDTAALSESSRFYGVNSSLKKGGICERHYSVICFELYSVYRLWFVKIFFQWKQAVIRKLKNDLFKIITFLRKWLEKKSLVSKKQLIILFKSFC